MSPFVQDAVINIELNGDRSYFIDPAAPNFQR
jgi:hypothetical protein